MAPGLSSVRTACRFAFVRTWLYFSFTLTDMCPASAMIVQALSNGMQASDYGHVDLLTARDADTRVWRPILDWIVTHP